MDTHTAVGEIVKLQATLQFLAAFNFTAHYFPPTAHVSNGSTYDYIIVGGGTAGCVVANRLTEDPNNNVLLIEAGGDPPLQSVIGKEEDHHCNAPFREECTNCCSHTGSENQNSPTDADRSRASIDTYLELAERKKELNNSIGLSGGTCNENHGNKVPSHEDKKRPTARKPKQQHCDCDFTHSTLLLTLMRSSSDWNYTAEYSKPNPKCSSRSKTDLFLGKMLGGVSGLDYMIYSQGSCRDYHSWASAANDDSWEWKNILPYIVKAEHLKDKKIDKTPDAAFHGFNGPVVIKKDRRPVTSKYLSCVEELGTKVIPDLNIHNSVGYTEGVFYVENGYRQSTAYTYIKPIKSRSNLHILKHTTVSRILFDDNRNAIAVEASINGAEKIIIKAQKEVIVSAGAINSPKLLMLSGIGPKKHLLCKKITPISDLPVGKNLQDHAAVILIHNMTKVLASPDFDDPVMYPGYSFNGHVSLKDSEFPEYPQYETLNFINVPRTMAQFCSIVYGFTCSMCDDWFKTATNTQMLWTTLSNLQPKSRGQVLLRSANFKDSPVVLLDLLTNEEDLNNQVRYVKDFVRIVNTTSFESMGAVFKEPNIPDCNCKNYEGDEYWKCYSLCAMFPLRRYCGTCAMGAVVDGRLRVRGVRRLRVVDASVIPTIPSGGTFLPTVVIAEKAADMIKQDC